jgi:hypothetical protein
MDIIVTFLAVVGAAVTVGVIIGPLLNAYTRGPRRGRRGRY